jgi:hypothetical protein
VVCVPTNEISSRNSIIITSILLLLVLYYYCRYMYVIIIHLDIAFMKDSEVIFGQTIKYQ